MKGVSKLFEDYLRSCGLRLTKQRAEIVKAIYATHKHVSAEGLYDLLRKHPTARELRISRATVYRTLSLLEEGGFIEALELGRDKGTLYEHVMGHDHHDHMVCVECERIIEFHDEELERVQEEVVKRHGFRTRSHRLNIYGTCAQCQAAGVGESEPLRDHSAG